MKPYSKVSKLLGKYAAGWLVLVLAGCTQDHVAGIDAGDNPDDEIAFGSSSDGLIVPPIEGVSSSSVSSISQPAEGSSSVDSSSVSNIASSSSVTSIEVSSSSTAPPPASSVSSAVEQSSSSLAPPVSSEPVASSSSSVAPPPPVQVSVVAQGPVNGFGSVIVHGDRYDTDNAQFFRNGVPTSEGSFEVGDMVTVFGFEEAGELSAREVHYQSAIRGVVEAYEYEAGIITMLGQRIKIDVGTVIGEGLDDRHLQGKSVSISGWLDDAEVSATRMNLSEEPLSEISGYANHVNTVGATLRVGDINIDCSQVEVMPPVRQGDVVKAVGTVVFPEVKETEGSDAEKSGSNSSRKFLAKQLFVLDSAAVAEAEQLVISGIVRNVEMGSRIWVNGIPVVLTQDTVVDNGSLRDIGADDAVTIRAERWNGYVLATHIHIDSREVIESLVGEITALDVTDEKVAVRIGEKVVTLQADTAIVDLSVHHSRLNAEQLMVGDYVVIEAAQSNSGLLAKTLKRTAVGENDRLFEGTDEAPYEWYFVPSEVNPNDMYENVLGARRFASVEVNNNIIVTADGLRLRLRNSHIQDQNKNAYTMAEILELLSAEAGSDRMIWLNFQVDSRKGNIWVDKLRVLWDIEGENVDFPIP